MKRNCRRDIETKPRAPDDPRFAWTPGSLRWDPRLQAAALRARQDRTRLGEFRPIGLAHRRKAPGLVPPGAFVLTNDHARPLQQFRVSGRWFASQVASGSTTARSRRRLRRRYRGGRPD